MADVRAALAKAFEGIAHNQDDGTWIADRALEVLRSLSVEDRAEAAGLVEVEIAWAWEETRIISGEHKEALVDDYATGSPPRYFIEIEKAVPKP